jgi:hypothetical protein
MKKLILFAFAAMSLWGADIAGKWKGKFTTPDGQAREAEFNFQVDGSKLTGTVVSPRGESKIEKGVVSANHIEFSVVRKMNGEERIFLYKGDVKNDEVKFEVVYTGADTPFYITAHKDKS